MNCFYVPGETHIIDTIDETGLSRIRHESFEQMKERYPGVEIWNTEEAFKEIGRLTYERMISPPKRVSFERFDEMLNVLPPMNWRQGGLLSLDDIGSVSSSESFMVCEALSLDLHSIFCRIGNHHFEMVNRRSLTHNQIVQLCLPLLQQQP